jgi:hypothetical protein
MFGEIILSGMLSSPLFYPEPIYRQVAKALLYLSPLIISLIASYYVYKKQKKYLFLTIFPISFYLLSIRPTTDIVHLAPLIAITGIPFLFIYKCAKNEIVKQISIFCLIGFILFGIYSVIYRGYYKWGAPILSNSYFYSDPRINVFVNNPDVIKMINDQLRSSKSEYVFIYHFSPIFYMTSDKKNPTYYDDLTIPLMTNSVQNDVISDIKKNRVDTIVSDSNLQKEQTIVARFVRDNFKLKKVIGGYQIWKTDN